jgi:hypothetical protein
MDGVVLNLARRVDAAAAADAPLAELDAIPLGTRERRRREAREQGENDRACESHLAASLYPEGMASASQRARTWVALAVAMAIVWTTQAASAAGPAVDAKWRVAMTGSGTSELVLTVTVESGWHLNANDADRPYVIPTTLDIEAPTGTTIESIRYPDAVVRSLGFAPDTPLRLYEGTFTIGVRVAGVPPERFGAKLGYQACNDETCLPPRTLPVPFEAKAAGGGK